MKYTQGERVQFGAHQPVQNTQFQLADMQAKLDGARLLIYRAAQKKAGSQALQPPGRYGQS